MTREAARVRVWDLPTRLFHWALAACVVMVIVSAHVGGSAMTWHMRFGYVIFTLLAFRLVWGFVGGRWSRFASFVDAPATIDTMGSRAIALAIAVLCAIGVAALASLDT